MGKINNSVDLLLFALKVNNTEVCQQLARYSSCMVLCRLTSVRFWKFKMNKKIVPMIHFDFKLCYKVPFF